MHLAGLAANLEVDIGAGPAAIKELPIAPKLVKAIEIHRQWVKLFEAF